MPEVRSCPRCGRTVPGPPGDAVGCDDCGGDPDEARAGSVPPGPLRRSFALILGGLAALVAGQCVLEAPEALRSLRADEPARWAGKLVAAIALGLSGGSLAGRSPAPPTPGGDDEEPDPAGPD